MNKIRLLMLMLAGSALAGPLRFKPDTVCAGNTTTCTVASTVVKNVSRDTAVFEARYMVSPTDAKSELAFYANKFGSLRWDPDYSPDSSRKLSNGYLQTFRSSYRQVKLAPGDSTKLEQFMFGTCLLCVGGGGGASSLPLLGHGEMVSLVFGSTKTGFDTLHAKVNKWVTGGIANNPFMRSAPHASESFRANGRPIDGRTPGIVLRSNGAAPLLPKSSNVRKAVTP